MPYSTLFFIVYGLLLDGYYVENRNNQDMNVHKSFLSCKILL